MFCNFPMTPASLGALIIRFVALGLLVYGMILLVRGLIAQSEIDRMQSLFGGRTGDDVIDSLGGVSLSKVVRTFFISSVAALVGSAVLFGLSRRLGALIGRGLE